MEGDSVTLHTHLTHIQRDDLIQWKFAPQGTLIAQIHNQRVKYFRDRLKLDCQTGSLTITNITSTDSGLYKLQISRRTGPSYKRFNVTVYALLPVPVISRVSNCSVLCSVMNVTHVSLSWYKGKSLLSSISVSDLNIRLSLPLEVEYQDTNTYRCVINNPITNHTQHLHINDVCESCSDLSRSLYHAALITGLVLLVML
ncbi:natural killer cell receptor 2B4-like [Triplophysa rosa]|uniref:natural killer cell receptor 2B4-like n=1 Tax=Triplophysa rosa TaxID=992332 RepID=UPI002546097B|nr:natural killer cell receptor 2B4-like [Triplophysa rosa]